MTRRHEARCTCKCSKNQFSKLVTISPLLEEKYIFSSTFMTEILHCIIHIFSSYTYEKVGRKKQDKEKNTVIKRKNNKVRLMLHGLCMWFNKLFNFSKLGFHIFKMWAIISLSELLQGLSLKNKVQIKIKKKILVFIILWK